MRLRLKAPEWGALGRAAKRAAGAFARNRDGNVAVLFAFSIIPLATLGLGVVDYNRATTVKLQLQDALDAAALAAARSNAVTNADLQTVGGKALAGNVINFPNATLLSSSFTTDGQGKVTATARVKVTMLVANAFLGHDTTVGASSEVVRANNKIEVALVLDNTGSMAGTKLSNLKTAATNLIDTLAAAAARTTATDPVKISLVPFSMTVRVGSQYKTANWIDQTGASPINDEIFTTATGTQHANRFTLFTGMGVQWAGCVESRKQPYDIQETAPTAGNPSTLFTPFFAPDEPDPKAKGKNGDLGTFQNNYLTDGTYSQSDWKIPQGSITKYTKAPISGTNSYNGYIYGPNAGCQMAPVQRLTTDMASLKTAINGMTAVGDTNIPIGLVWGWHTLSPIGPFSDGVAYGTPKTKKIVILMTDGDNNISSASNDPNVSYYSGVGYPWQNRLGTTSSATSRTAALDDRLAKLCANMKAPGVDIEIYTVRVEVTSGPSTVLSNCASTPDKYFDVQNAANLNAVFQAIAGSIANLHLSR